MSCHPVPQVQELFANANLLFIQNMRRAYAIRPYSIWDFPAPYCQDGLGLSSYPFHPGSCPDLGLSSNPFHPGSTTLTLHPQHFTQNLIKRKRFSNGENEN